MDVSLIDLPSQRQALVLLPLLLPICLWVAWSDLKFMKIPNKAVLSTLALWLLLGWVATGNLSDWAWGAALFAVVLALGFIGNLAGLFGAGDAKFAAAMAPFFVGGAPQFLLYLYIGCSLTALLLHRVMRNIPAITALAPDWKSWTSKKFPMGLALASMLLFYHLAAFLPKG